MYTCEICIQKNHMCVETYTSIYRMYANYAECECVCVRAYFVFSVTFFGFSYCVCMYIKVCVYASNLQLFYR